MTALHEWTSISSSFQLPPCRADSLAALLLRELKVEASVLLAQQRGREFGFGPGYDRGERRGTDLSAQPASTINKLPTNNIVCERKLSKVDRLADRRGRGNTRGKFLRDLVPLSGCHDVTRVLSSVRRLVKPLRQLEAEFESVQRRIRDDKLEVSLQRAAKADTVANTLVKRCKAHAGPFTTLEELENFVATQDRESKEFRLALRNEVYFKRKTTSLPETDPLFPREQDHGGQVVSKPHSAARWSGTR